MQKVAIPEERSFCRCVIDEGDTVALIVKEVNGNHCRYHRQAAKERAVRITSRGMCPLAATVLYPSLFALHCRPDAVSVQATDAPRACPLGRGGSAFVVRVARKKQGPLEYLNNTVRRLANLIKPVEVFDKDISVEVAAKGPLCAAPFKTGDTFPFNLDDQDEICPAAGNSVYPFIGEGGSALLGCPDYETHVRYLARAGGSGGAGRLRCEEYDVELQVAGGTLGDLMPLESGKWYGVDDLLATLGIPCLTTFHVALPYLKALARGGRLGYLTNDPNQAGICCPAPLAVRYRVEKEGAGTYRYRCTQADSACPRGVREGQQVVVKDFRRLEPFYDSLDELFVVAKKWGGLKTGPGDSFSFGGGGVLWNLRRKSASNTGQRAER